MEHFQTGMSVSYRISGPVYGGPVNRLLTFTADIKVDEQIPKQCKKTDLKVYIEGPPNTNYNANIMGGDRGKFTVSFTPTVPGFHWADFVFKGTWAAQPYKFPISDGPNCPENEYEGKYRSGNVPLPLTSSASISSPPPEDPEEKKKKEEEKQRKLEEEEKHRKLAEERLKEEETKREHEAQIRRAEDRKRKHEEEEIRQEAERKRLEEENRLAEERAKKELSRSEKAQKLEKMNSKINQFSVLSNEELVSEINQTLEKLQILLNIQSKRLN